MLIQTRTEERHGIRFRILTAAITVLFLCSVTVTAFAYSAKTVSVTVSDDHRSVTISAQKGEDPADMIKAAGFTVSANDKICLDNFDSEDGGEIVIERAKTVRIVDHDDVVYCVGYSTLDSALSNVGISLEEDDVSSVPLDSSVYSGMQVEIKRAFPVTIEADGETQEIYTVGGTVSDLLEQAGVEVNEYDSVDHNITNEISDTTTITVDRVEYKERVSVEPIPFTTVKKIDPSMFEGESEVTVKGVEGSKQIIYEDKFNDNELITSKIVSETVLEKPVDEIISIGSKKRPALINFRDGVRPMSYLTKPSYVELDDNGLPVNYVDYYIGEATAYTGDPATASGRVPMQGHVAVDPKKFPYGTELYIVSLDGKYVYGYCIAADTGGFVYTSNTMIDLYMDTESMCDEWGRRDVAVYVISYAK